VEALNETQRYSVVFIGFMGAGKSRTLRRARAAGWDVADSDAMLEDELGMPIAEFFEREGEAEFRRREEELALRVLGRAGGGAVALGGGAVLSERTRRALSGHAVVWLPVSPEIAWERVTRKGGRPLANDRDAFERLHAEREPLYAELASARMFWAESESGDYPAFVGGGILTADLWPLPGRRFVITDETVGAIYPHAGESAVARIAIPPGEGSKTMAEAERVLRELANDGMTRGDHIAAVGGGVVGDLAGFCAATYQRGVPVAQFPTSLVAQVDSAYGGKTGVDIPEAKNYVGAYHQPAAVIADVAALATLPAEELRAGFTEVLKTALLAGGDLWERVRALEEINPAAIADIVFACARFKAGVVAEDERDAGRRQILNLGHTVGHAIEAASGYGRYRHGEAVGLGLLAALRLSDAEALRAEVDEALARHELPTALDEDIDPDAIAAAIERDKKATAEGPRFVLLSEPGSPIAGERVDPARVRAAVDELRS
jgi:shikimate kinase/3-dehydroquinate synthase